MKAVMDIGNTRVKAASISESGISEVLIEKSAQAGKMMAVGKLLNSLVGVDEWGVLSSQSSEFNSELTTFLKNSGARVVHLLSTSKHCCGVTVAYPIVEQLGSDRLAAMIAAYEKIQDAVIVVDCGTAVTVDAVNAEGEQLGGVILPGLTLMRDSLIQRAPGVMVEQAAWMEWPNNTGSGLWVGTQEGLRHSIMGIVKQIQERTASDTAVILTGGDARNVCGELSANWEIVDNLVLQGAAMMLSHCAFGTL